jgi:formylglycine-generating enzyme required for sulfatase activity
MVVVPAGDFMMGSDAERDEQPVRKVTIPRPFAAGRFEITEDNWDTCLEDGGCGDYEPWGTGKKHRGQQPAANVSFNDAKVFMAWLSKKSGKTYRLLSEAEWEFAARAGTTTRFPWGRDAGAGQANCTDCGSTFNGRIAPAGSFPPNPFGLHDMHGNVWEWVEDCYVNSYGRPPGQTYAPAPSDGTARIDDAVCKTNHGSRVLRGGSYNEASSKARSSARYIADPSVRNITMGFRVARGLE